MWTVGAGKRRADGGGERRSGTPSPARLETELRCSGRALEEEEEGRRQAVQPDGDRGIRRVWWNGRDLLTANISPHPSASNHPTITAQRHRWPTAQTRNPWESESRPPGPPAPGAAPLFSSKDQGVDIAQQTLELTQQKAEPETRLHDMEVLDGRSTYGPWFPPPQSRRT